MKIRRIEITNVRCFRHVVFDLLTPDDGGTPMDIANPYTLTFGLNGSGKTSLFKIVCNFFTKLAPLYQGGDLNSGDARVLEELGSVRVVWEDVVRETPCLFDVEYVLGAEAPTPSIIEHPANHPRLKQGTLAEWTAAFTNSPFTKIGIIIALDAYRQLFGRGNHAEILDCRARALQETIQRSGSGFDSLVHWVKDCGYAARDAASHNVEARRWKVIEDVLNAFLAPCRITGFRPTDFLVTDTRADDNPAVSSWNLGAGAESLFIIAAELLYRLSATGCDPEDILYQEAVLLVDDLDLHLHPRIQDDFYRLFRSTFPNVQLIASTHSPYMVGAVAPYQAFKLEPEDEKK